MSGPDGGLASLVAALDRQERDALDDLEHNCDLIGVRPLPCERDHVLAVVRSQFFANHPTVAPWTAVG